MANGEKLVLTLSGDSDLVLQLYHQLKESGSDVNINNDSLTVVVDRMSREDALKALEDLKV